MCIFSYTYFKLFIEYNVATNIHGTYVRNLYRFQQVPVAWIHTWTRFHRCPKKAFSNLKHLKKERMQHFVIGKFRIGWKCGRGDVTLYTLFHENLCKTPIPLSTGICRMNTYLYPFHRCPKMYIPNLSVYLKIYVIAPINCAVKSFYMYIVRN
jgi:hypothetical protein